MLVAGWTLRAQAVGDFECADTKAIDYVYVALPFTGANHDVAALFQALECDKSNAAIFVREIWPNDIVENVLLYGIDSAGQCGKRFWLGRRVESCSIDRKAG